MHVRHAKIPISLSRRMKSVSSAVGAAAFLAMAFIGVSMSPPDTGVVHIPQAGSGSAPANTTYTQPVVGDMSLGATATESTPATVPAVSMASPTVKAGH